MKQLHEFDEVFDSQKTFRILLEAMANPFRELSIAEASEKMYGGHPQLLAVAMTLLDNEVSFHVCGDEGLAEQIRLLTHAKETDLADADYIFLTDHTQLKEAVQAAKIGTLEDPHKGATLIVENSGEKSISGTFYGPGIDDLIDKRITELMHQAVCIRDEQEYEYPQGIDYIFVTKDGAISCIPRLVLRGK